MDTLLLLCLYKVVHICGHIAFAVLLYKVVHICGHIAFAVLLYKVGTYMWTHCFCCVVV